MSANGFNLQLKNNKPLNGGDCEYEAWNSIYYRLDDSNPWKKTNNISVTMKQSRDWL